jgi:hypothetical protein
MAAKVPHVSAITTQIHARRCRPDHRSRPANRTNKVEMGSMWKSEKRIW